jgi:hypothetical protein
VDGITINRAILAKEGKDPLDQLRKITSTVSGPVSAVFVRRKDDFAIDNKQLTWDTRQARQYEQPHKAHFLFDEKPWLPDRYYPRQCACCYHTVDVLGKGVQESDL